MSGVHKLDVRYVDVGKNLTTKKKFTLCDHMLQYVFEKSAKLSFGIIIVRFNFGSSRRHSYAMMNYEKMVSRKNLSGI